RTAHHRRPPPPPTTALLQIGNRAMIVAMVFLAAGLTGILILICEMLFGARRRRLRASPRRRYSGVCGSQFR
ncbi:MAG TPA: hypothetical protein VIJ20_06850, partial [Solirubrobacteraceae bacterium]